MSDLVSPKLQDATRAVKSALNTDAMTQPLQAGVDAAAGQQRTKLEEMDVAAGHQQLDSFGPNHKIVKEVYDTVMSEINSRITSKAQELYLRATEQVRALADEMAEALAGIEDKIDSAVSQQCTSQGFKAMLEPRMSDVMASIAGQKEQMSQLALDVGSCRTDSANASRAFQDCVAKSTVDSLSGVVALCRIEISQLRQSVQSLHDGTNNDRDNDRRSFESKHHSLVQELKHVKSSQESIKVKETNNRVMWAQEINRLRHQNIQLNKSMDELRNHIVASSSNNAFHQYSHQLSLDFNTSSLFQLNDQQMNSTYAESNSEFGSHSMLAETMNRTLNSLTLGSAADVEYDNRVYGTAALEVAPESAMEAPESSFLEDDGFLGEAGFYVTLTKVEGEDLGLQVSHQSGTLRIESLTAGGAAERSLQVGDRIQDVNGITQGSKQMLDECLKKNQLRLGIVRSVGQANVSSSVPELQ